MVLLQTVTEHKLQYRYSKAHIINHVYCVVSVGGSCRGFSDSSSRLDLCSFLTAGSENPGGYKRLEEALENFVKLKGKQYLYPFISSEDRSKMNIDNKSNQGD